jgi:hypothetical protein
MSSRRRLSPSSSCRARANFQPFGQAKNGIPSVSRALQFDFRFSGVLQNARRGRCTATCRDHHVSLAGRIPGTGPAGLSRQLGSSTVPRSVGARPPCGATGAAIFSRRRRGGNRRWLQRVWAESWFGRRLRGRRDLRIARRPTIVEPRGELAPARTNCASSWSVGVHLGDSLGH